MLSSKDGDPDNRPVETNPEDCEEDLE